MSGPSCFKASLAKQAQEEINLLSVLWLYNQMHFDFFVEKMIEAFAMQF